METFYLTEGDQARRAARLAEWHRRLAEDHVGPIRNHHLEQADTLEMQAKRYFSQQTE